MIASPLRMPLDLELFVALDEIWHDPLQSSTRELVAQLIAKGFFISAEACHTVRNRCLQLGFERLFGCV
jgi:hypothetical protein